MEANRFLTHCPICDCEYVEKNDVTKHHVFPKYWYGANGIKVRMCADCHRLFNVFYPMTLNKPWERNECLVNLFLFCKYKNKDPLIIYPKLSNFIT